ncbi:Pycsar system effector family protein [Mangrovimonas spongiae]|uniref:HD domain-containing protein n=1 Tax=Mangrovimonas spongiae TaxID=2494697 RepID=A0A3R9N978_9FLAO|nr:Pycsar system effector family protein [Mangrovimonas spongiae]RSK41893.1 HD domain-containing protein [Mangrovimonas spongiae]
MTTLEQQSLDFVFNLFKTKLSSTFLYHNYTHTERVLKSVNEIIEAVGLSDDEKLIIRLAAIFHDVGYATSTKQHEKESAKVAKRFLEDKKVSSEIVSGVTRCILATCLDEAPTTLLEQILCDADTSHFGKKYFEETSELLRKEFEIQDVVYYTHDEWLEENIKMLAEKHKFFTEYAIKNWQPQKEKNLTDLIKKKKKKAERVAKEKLRAKYKKESPERGVQTFYRVALRNHIKLSDIADTKANILLSVNAIIISLIISNLLSKLDNPSNAYLIWPTVIFVLFSLISIVLSIIATRPNITRGEFTKEDVENKNVNLTFFGNFHKMKLEEFEWAVNELLQDKDYVYSSLTKDLYFLGKVLDRKYRILRITYSIFMVGIVVSILAFGISFNIMQGGH